MLLGLAKEFSISQGVPTSFKRGFNLMRSDMPAEGGRRTLIKQDLHSRDFQRARGMLEDGTGLLQLDAWEPLEEIGELSSVFEILK